MAHRLLVVDSDRRFLQDHQASLGTTFDAEFMEGTEGALARLEDGGFSAVLLCVEASENKGYSLCTAIRRSPALAGLKVALISAKATAEEYARHQNLNWRADLYLHKPIRPNALIAALGPILPLNAANPDQAQGDLGGEWLESLKTELEIATVPQEPGQSLAHQATQRLPAGSGGVQEHLEARIRELEAQLAAQAVELKSKTRQALELDALLGAANEQLEQDAEELGRLRHQGQAAREQVEEKDRLLQELELSLRAANDERDQAVQTLRQLRQQEEADQGMLGDTARMTQELVESNRLLKAQLAECQEELQRLARSEQSLVARNLDLESERDQSLGARETLERSLADLHQQLNLAEETRERQQTEWQAQLEALEAQVAAQQEQILLLQQEKETSAERIQVRSDRLLALSEHLEELEQQARNTLELAKAEIK